MTNRVFEILFKVQIIHSCPSLPELVRLQLRECQIETVSGVMMMVIMMMVMMMIMMMMVIMMMKAEMMTIILNMLVPPSQSLPWSGPP